MLPELFKESALCRSKLFVCPVNVFTVLDILVRSFHHHFTFIPLALFKSQVCHRPSFSLNTDADEWFRARKIGALCIRVLAWIQDAVFWSDRDDEAPTFLLLSVLIALKTHFLWRCLSLMWSSRRHNTCFINENMPSSLYLWSLHSLLFLIQILSHMTKTWASFLYCYLFLSQINRMN